MRVILSFGLSVSKHMRCKISLFVRGVGCVSEEVCVAIVHGRWRCEVEERKGLEELLHGWNRRDLQLHIIGRTIAEKVSFARQAVTQSGMHIHQRYISRTLSQSQSRGKWQGTISIRINTPHTYLPNPMSYPTPERNQCITGAHNTYQPHFL